MSIELNTSMRSQLTGNVGNIEETKSQSVNNSAIFRGTRTVNVNQQSKVDVREKEDVQKTIKDFVKKNNLKKIKLPGGDGDTKYYTNDKWIMSVTEANDGSTTVHFHPTENNKPAIDTEYKYDLEGHMTQESKFIGSGIELRYIYKPDGTVIENTYQNGKYIEGRPVKK